MAGEKVTIVQMSKWGNAAVQSSPPPSVKFFTLFFGSDRTQEMQMFFNMQEIGIISVIEAEASRARGHSGHEAPPS